MEANRSFILNTDEFLQSQQKIYFEMKDRFSKNDETFERELHVISGVLTYYNLYSKRTVEVIPMYCSKGLMNDFGEQMKKNFQRRFGVICNIGLPNCERFAQNDRCAGTKTRVEKESKNSG